MSTKTLNTQAIRIDGGTQSRVQINNDTVADYAESIKEGVTLPAITVFFDGTDYFLADGFHRLHACNTAGKTSIVADVITGTLRDAILYSLSANVIHGLPPSSDDKRKAVGIMLADPEWSELSDREIARHCGCSRMTVGRMRNPEPEKKAPAAVTSDTQAPASKAKPSVTSDTPAPTAKTDKQVVAEQNAEEAHGETDPIAMWEEAEKQVASLTLELEAAQADDKQAEIIKWRRLADVAARRQDELMDTLNVREKELTKQAKWLRRIGAALNEDDNSKLPAKVEALVRAQKAEA